MNGGYINEEGKEPICNKDTKGGQLKSKNGQKYVINSEPDGYVIPKHCAYIIGVLVVAAMIIVFLLTYFLLGASRCASIPTLIQPYNNSDSSVFVSKAGLFSSPSQVSNDHSPTDRLINRSTNSTTTTTTKTITTAKIADTSTTNRPIPIPVTVKDTTHAIQADESIDDSRTRQIEFHNGWSPVHYKLLIEPDFVSASSRGDITIDIIKNPLDADQDDAIVLDIHNITILNTIVILSETESSPAKTLAFETEYGDLNATFIITIKDKLIENTTVQIQLVFVSQLTDTLQGFYRTYYETMGESRWLASTQFSPIDARRAFPCFDRPDQKAHFEISVIRPETISMSLSNMPSKTQSYSKPGYIREDFDVTPRMSTYLVAFIVSDLVNANVSVPEENPYLPIINVWTRKEVSDMTSYIYRMTVKVLPFLEQYFGVKFNLPKIDLVAVPDFGFNAMENWGLITFRESALLVAEDEELRSSSAHTERVAYVLAHELAHQWFGNLVTMRWWNDLWLKEGFATYMSYLSLNTVEPTWQMMNFFSINEMQKAMDRDSDKYSHAISFPVSTPADIRRMFDPISYSKGASVIRMMNGFLGDKAFQSGLTAYLKKFQYANAIQDDLWEIMTEYGHAENSLSNDTDVKQIMDTWTLQAGYPVVTCTRQNDSIIFSQHRYMLPEIDLNDSSRWYVPITISKHTLERSRRRRVASPVLWLSKLQNLTVSMPELNPTDLFYININRSGYYRVNYDKNSWLSLSRNFTELPPIIQGQLLDDSLHLARAELLGYDVPLFLLVKLYLTNDTVLPWAAAQMGISYLRQMLIREAAYENFRALMKHVIKPSFENVGFDEVDGESHVRVQHRARIISTACVFGNDKCINRAQHIFREWMRDMNNNRINPNLKSVIYCTAIREGTHHEWYFAYERYLKTTSASEKDTILGALGCTTKPWLLSKYLNMTISATSGIRKQDGARAFSSVAENSVGYEMAFEFLVSNIKEISEYFGDGFSTISRMVDSVTTFMNKPIHLEQFEKFGDKTKELGLTSIETSIHLAMEQVRINIFWRKRSYYKLQAFLEQLVNKLHLNII